MKLWTIARPALAERALSSGRATASWEHVEPRWRPAYEWMLERMHERGIANSPNSTDSPPIWAWHSWDGWQNPPTSETIDMLLGLEPCNRQGLCMITWTATADRVLLSRYNAWCDLLDRVVAGDPLATDGREILCPPWTTMPATGWAPAEALQACAPALHGADIISVVALESWR